MEGSKKRGSGSKKTQTRPKVRQNLGEPARFRLQDEPDTNQPPEQQPYYPHPIQPSQNQQQHYPQPYENRPYIPTFSTQEKWGIVETWKGSRSGVRKLRRIQDG